MIDSVDVTRKNFDDIDFCESVIAFAAPAKLPGTVRMRVWGVMFHPRCAGCPKWIVPPRADPDDSLYISGWSTLSFEGVVGGEIEVGVYEPSLDRDVPGFLSVDGEQFRLRREWCFRPDPSLFEYELNCVLQSPFGSCVLKLTASGKSTLEINSESVVLAADFSTSPHKYGWSRNVQV